MSMPSADDGPDSVLTKPTLTLSAACEGAWVSARTKAQSAPMTAFDDGWMGMTMNLPEGVVVRPRNCRNGPGAIASSLTLAGPGGGERAIRSRPLPVAAAARGHGPVEAAQVERPHLVEFDRLGDAAGNALRHQDLAAARLAAQARRQVGHGADRAVVEAALEADRAERRVALRDADAEAELVAALRQPSAQSRDRSLHRERHARRALRRRRGPAPGR